MGRMKTRGSVVLAGYFGFGNLGDEALRAALEEALEKAGHPPPLVLARRPKGPREIGRARPVRVLRALRRSTALVFGGGGLLQNRTSGRSLAYYLSLVLLARLARRPVFLFGQGIGPIQGRFAQGATRLALRRVRRIGCRDEGSLAFLRSLGLSGVLDGDALFLLPPLGDGEAPERRDRPRVVLALKGGGRSAPRPLLERWKVLLCRLHELRDVSFTLLVSFPEEDLPLAQALDRSVDVPSRIACPGTAEEATQELAGAALLVGSRLHALEMGLRAGVPLLAIPEDPKIARFVEDARAFSAPEIPLSVFPSPEDVVSLIDAPPDRRRLLGAYQALHERTSRAFAAFLEDLGGAQGADRDG